MASSEEITNALSSKAIFTAYRNNSSCNSTSPIFSFFFFSDGHSLGKVHEFEIEKRNGVEEGGVELEASFYNGDGVFNSYDGGIPPEIRNLRAS